MLGAGPSRAATLAIVGLLVLGGLAVVVFQLVLMTGTRVMP
jgi:hypothetical protein